MQCALRNDLVDAGEIRKVPDAIRILVIPGEVLDHRDDMSLLNCRHLSRCHLAIKKWIFSKGLCRPAPMPGAHRVQGRADDF